MPTKEYTRTLTSEDNLKIEFETYRGQIIYFVVHYYAKIEGKWYSILRIDNNHGFTHKHVYHLHSKEFKISLNQDNNTLFNFYKNYIEDNYSVIKENFLKT